jgi:hypothetical protein
MLDSLRLFIIKIACKYAKFFMSKGIYFFVGKSWGYITVKWFKLRDK